MQQLHLETRSDPTQLKPLRRAVEAFCTACGFDEKAVGDIGLCVNEAVANITRHAYGGAIDRPVFLDAVFKDHWLELKLRDWGNGKDPSKARPKTDLMTPGGLGMVCLRSLLDEVVYIPQPDGMLMVMKKRLA